MKLLTGSPFLFVILSTVAHAQAPAVASNNNPATVASLSPPLEVNVAGTSENGRSELVVVYHANHTFEMTEMAAATYSFSNKDASFPKRTGVWWWKDHQTFCFRYDTGGSAGKNHCKNNGHLIGRVDYNGRPVSQIYP
jgi:hypothetical protein